MSISQAKQLLIDAAREARRLERHLLVAASLSAAFDEPPIVVGGTAEEFWTRADYHETDLDLVAHLTPKHRKTLAELGFLREGRHWFHEGSGVAVEFPGDHLDGSLDRTYRYDINGGQATIISIEDLYLDRVRQATMSWPRKDINYQAAVAVAVADMSRIAGLYTGKRLREIASVEPQTGAAMKQVDSRIRREIRRSLSKP